MPPFDTITPSAVPPDSTASPAPLNTVVLTSSAPLAICAVPLLIQDLKKKDSPLWAYFAQIGDSTTSYGSYSGAVPNEKITWGKLSIDTPRFVIESDATIVAPLMFAYILGW